VRLKLRLTRLLAASLLLVAAGRQVSSDSPEHRALWAYAWGNGFKTPDEVAGLVGRAKSANCNVVVVEVRKTGDAYYIPFRPNNDVRASDIAEGFDPLQEVINQAHAEGIQVYAWVVVYRVATSVPADPDHIYNRHSEWLCMANNGSTSFGEGYYVDPGVPGAAEWNFNVCLDLISRYDIDGLVFDIIRYPQQNSGYNPIALQRFRDRYGLAPGYVPQYTDSLFSAWRREQVTHFVRKVYASMLDVKPNVVLAAATFSDRNDAYNYRFQDWRTWMMSGILDANYPMTYTTSLTTFTNRVNDAVANSGGRHVYVLQGSYMNTIQDSMAQLLRARANGAQGEGIYRYCFTHKYDTNTDEDDESEFYSALVSQVYSGTAVVPVMTWKSSPTWGHVKGRVIDATQGKPVDAAWVTIDELGLGTYGDGTGFYAHLNVTPGTYTLTVSKAGYAPQSKPVTINAGSVTTIDFVLSGTAVGSIASAKQMSDGIGVALPPAVVTAGNNQLLGKFYVQDVMRTSGILVELPSDSDVLVHPGDVVRVFGPLGTSADGERRITSPVVLIESVGGQPPEPIEMCQKDLGGEAGGPNVPGVTNGLGVNNIGLLVRTSGRVVGVDQTNQYFYLDDGSGCSDGSEYEGIRVYYGGLAPGNTITAPSVGDHVRVTGISWIYRIGENRYRAIRMRDQNDLVLDSCPSLTAPPQTILPGWNVISVPRTPKDPAPSETFGSVNIDGCLWRWDAVTHSFNMYDPWMPEAFGNILRGEGYWLNAESACDLTFNAFSPGSTDFWIGLPRNGWQLVGCPFDDGKEWDTALITDGLEVLPIIVASKTRGWMDSVGWWWDNVTQSLKTVGFPEDFPESETLMPWHGCWLMTYRDRLALIVQD